ncbi:MAG: hypothetical protein GY761_19740 [Hyphomicrobiales bacterium]|nr:hypothetical protein [Hyphomicrobiales bacterium]
MKKSAGKKGLGCALILVILAGVIVVGFGYSFFSWRQELTVEVETPAGVVSASSVVGKSVTVMDGPFVIFPEAKGANGKITGEAVVLEVVAGKYLFALLKGVEHYGDAGQQAYNTFDDDIVDRLRTIGPAYFKPRVKATLPFKAYPLLVTFTDINDPASVVRVDPYDLAAHFGAGVKLKSVTLEITGEPVTQGGVEKVLGWWKEENKPANFEGPFWDWKHPEFDISKALRIRDFIKGERK